MAKSEGFYLPGEVSRIEVLAKLGGDLCTKLDEEKEEIEGGKKEEIVERMGYLFDMIEERAHKISMEI